MALIKCFNCGNEVSSDAVQCPHCKVKLSPQYDLCQCPECQNTIRINQWTCPHCGYRRSKVDYYEKIVKGCFWGSLSLVLWLFIAMVCFVVLFNIFF